MQTLERQTVAPVHPRSRRPAPWPVEFYRSAVGKKWVMALTGIMLMGFVFAHMVGNLKVYLGAEEFNHYGEFLRELFVQGTRPSNEQVSEQIGSSATDYEPLVAHLT